jgi:glycerate 2-kinase
VNPPRADADAIFRAAVHAVEPARLVAVHLSADGDGVTVVTSGRAVARWPHPTLVVGAGKAAARMAAGCEAVLGAARVRGLVITAEGCTAPLGSVHTVEAGHPLPDARGEAATSQLLRMVTEAGPAGVVCLISGGASALLVSPRPPLTLQDKIETTRLLLNCGASIGEFTTVRKHLSQVKGGGLLRRCHGELVALILSDVPGDDPSTIGSGPTAVDPTTFADAQRILQRHGLLARIPPRVAGVLERGSLGLEPETVKAGDADAARGHNLIIGSNRTALDGAAREAERRGWVVQIEEQVLVGDTADAARRFAARLRLEWLARERVPRCILAGGETTVRVRGRGRGGRNQEFALAAAWEIADSPIVVLSAGTDGVDGPTPAAGAFADGQTLRRARDLGLDPAAALADNDSYTFFSRLGDLYQCGPTGTNVMDIKIALLPDRRR